MLRFEQDPTTPGRIRTVPFDVTAATLSPEDAADPARVEARIADLTALWPETRPPLAGMDDTVLCLQPKQGREGIWNLCAVWFGATSEYDEFLVNGTYFLERIDCPEGRPEDRLWTMNERAIDRIYLRGPDDPLLTAPAPTADELTRIERWLDDIILVLVAAAGTPVQRTTNLVLYLPTRPPGPNYHRRGGHPLPDPSTRSKAFADRTGLPLDTRSRAQKMLDDVCQRLGIGGSHERGARRPDDDSEIEPNHWEALVLEEWRALIKVVRPVHVGFPSAQETVAARRRLRELGLDV